MTADPENAEARPAPEPDTRHPTRSAEVWRLATVGLACLIVGAVIGFAAAPGGEQPITLRPPPPLSGSVSSHPPEPQPASTEAGLAPPEAPEAMPPADEHAVLAPPEAPEAMPPADEHAVLAPPEAPEAMTPTDEHTVVYRDGHFWPERLDVVTGDTVVFLNDSEQPVWPASNIHPTHAILPEFDPLGVIRPGEAWQHTFTKSGYWRYHNHIEPSEVGMIVALGAPEDVEPLPAVLEPLRFPAAPPGTADDHDLVDDDAALAAFVETYGPTQATLLLSDRGIATGWSCHDRAHEVGRLSYEIHGPASIVSSPHECQAGAMHGALEALFADRGTGRLDSDFLALCSAFADDFARHNCLHGIGHGLMAWTSYELHEALGLCGRAPSDWAAASCASGVFMENVVGGLSGLMGHETEYLRPDDPVFPCDAVAEQWVDDCYFYQTSHMAGILGGDFAAVSELCAEAPETAQLACYASMGRDVSVWVGKDPAAGIAQCGHAPDGPPRVECLQGAMQDAFWSAEGAPTAAEFCRLLAPGSAEAERCYEVLLDRARSVLSDPSQRAGLCESIHDGYWRHECRDRLNDSHSY